MARPACTSGHLQSPSDQALAIAGSVAPRPEEFPFTEEGRREYYEAVRRSAQQQMMMQHQQHMHAIQAARAQAAREAEEQRRTAFLLLSP